MGVLTRPGSPYLWIWVPGVSTKPENTKILIGATATERKANRQTAEQIIATRLIGAAKTRAGVPAEPVAADAVTFRTYAEHYQVHVIPNHRGAYRERQILPRLIEAFGPLALAVPADVWTETVKAWRTARLQTPTTVPHYGGQGGTRHQFVAPSPRTVNREVGLLKQILSAAVNDKKIGVSPLANLGALKTDAINRRLTTLDEEARLLARLAPDDKAIYILARDGLVRLGDCLDLRRDDDEGTMVTIRYPKNGDPLTVPVSTSLRAALDAVPVDPDAPEWYFPRRRVAKDDQARTRGYIKAIARACRDATPPIPYGKKAGGITFHWGTRMTGATRMIHRGGDGVIAHVAKVGGWKSTAVLLEIYQKTVTEDMRRVVEFASGTPTPTPAPRLRRRNAARLGRVK